MKLVPSRSGRLTGKAIDDGLETVRLTAFVFVLVDLVSTLAALSYGRLDFGPSGPLAAAQMVLVVAAAATAMWNRPWAALALTAVVVVVEFAVTPSGMELWLLLITGVTIAARAGRRVVVLGALAHVAHAVAFGLSVDSRHPGSGWGAGLLTVAFSAAAFAVGSLARLLLRVRDRWWSRVRELERGNIEIRTVERRRLADDLQVAVTRGLTAIGEVVDAARTSSAPQALARGLAQVDVLSRSLLAELRVLLEVLRSEGAPGQQVAAPERVVGARRLVNALTARHVRLTVAAVLGLTALRSLVSHLAGSSEAPTSAVVVELVSLTACACAAAWPAAGAPCAVVALVVATVVDPTGYQGVLPAALVCLLVGVRSGPRGGWWVVLGLSGYGAVLTARTPDDPVTHLIVLGYIGGLAWVGGLVVRHLLLAREVTRQHAVDLLEERLQVEGQERSALARELHDVVAHQLSLSTMLVMAASCSDDPETLRGTLEKVRSNTEAARSELETLLRTMRGPQADQARPTPLVTATSNADALGKRLRDHGLNAVMSIDPAADELDATTQRTTSRILQEATTNILRYAPAGSRCDYTVTVQDGEVSVVISSMLPTDGPANDLSLGWGLQGIRERVELVHGTFRAGPEGRSWVVAVTLPVLLADDRPSAGSLSDPDEAGALTTPAPRPLVPDLVRPRLPR